MGADLGVVLDAVPSYITGEAALSFLGIGIIGRFRTSAA